MRSGRIPLCEGANDSGNLHSPSISDRVMMGRLFDRIESFSNFLVAHDGGYFAAM
jgi:hypothetical protein